jgi:lipopolysaccharide export system permease protein
MILGGALNRFLFGELLKVFLMTLTVLTSLFLIGLVVQQANQLGLSLGQTITAIPYLVPSTLPFTIPATTLVASCVVYARLSQDNEALAMKAAGIDLFTVLRPAALLGLLAAGATFGLSHTIIPHTQIALHHHVLKDPEEVLYNLLKREKTFRQPASPFVIFVRDVQGRRLLDVVIKRRKKLAPGQDPIFAGYDYITRAREARLSVDQDRSMLILKLYGWSAVGDDRTASLFTDDNPEIEIPLPEIFLNKPVKNRLSALTWDELPVRMADARATQADLERRWQDVQDMARATNNPSIAAIQEPLYMALIREHVFIRLSALAEYHLRPALAVSCFAFALIGCPVGLRASRADYLSVFMVCFLPSVLVYYPLLLAGANIAKNGRAPAEISVWAANAFGLVAAFVLSRLLIRR